MINSSFRPQLLGSLAVGVGLLGCLAACATVAPGGPGDPTPGTVSSGHLPAPGPSTSLPAGISAPNTLTPQPATHLRRERWTRATPVPDEAALLIEGTLTGGPPCTVLGRVEVAESKQSVLVTVWVGQAKSADCGSRRPGLAMPYVTRVALAAPLGSRTVRDGAA